MSVSFAWPVRHGNPGSRGCAAEISEFASCPENPGGEEGRVAETGAKCVQSVLPGRRAILSIPPTDALLIGRRTERRPGAEPACAAGVAVRRQRVSNACFVSLLETKLIPALPFGARWRRLARRGRVPAPGRVPTGWL